MSARAVSKSMTREDPGESIAREWLESQGHKKIDRPDKDPPDFEVDGKYAVGVMQIGSLITVSGRDRNEREVLKRLEDSVRDALESLGPPVNGRGQMLDGEYDYKNKPRPRSKVIKLEIEASLSNVENIRVSGEIELPCGILLRPVPWFSESFKFELNNFSDETGIWVMSELERSIRFAMDKKCRKVAGRVKNSRYHKWKWWLLLIDHILHVGPQAYKHEAVVLSRQIPIQNPFARVVVIPSKDPLCYWELSSPSVRNRGHGGAISQTD